MTTEREEIELHPAVGELIVKMRADLATAIARADAAEFALQCEATRHEETRAAVREYLAAVDERDKARRAPAQKGSYLRLVEAQDRLDAAREALRKITEEDGR